MLLAYYQSVDLFLFCPLSRKENTFLLCEPPPGRRPHGPEAASRAKRAVMFYSCTYPPNKTGTIPAQRKGLRG